MSNKESKIIDYRQGSYILKPEHSKWTQERKHQAYVDASRFVISPITGESICHCSNPKDAAFIARELREVQMLRLKEGAHNNSNENTK